ncbi:acyltransferase Pun1-like [Nicotiana sylvestris]|uniref:acyltransferase Pun1-like n=1 Tax=Nicotiana sylvestris TaxID=4096 RepID=UPI00388CD1D5
MDPTKIFYILEDSLSKTLSSYYPYAERLEDNTILNCNDAGAEFVQVQINSPISEFLQWHNNAIEEMIFPQGLPWSNCTKRALVVAQISYFNCGGIIVSMCIFHKVGDGYSGYNLFKDFNISSNKDESIHRRCTFSGLKLDELKASLVAKSSVKNPSRNEVVRGDLQQYPIFMPSFNLYLIFKTIDFVTN